MSSKVLPPNPDISHLKKQAKDLLADVRRGDPDAVGRVKNQLTWHSERRGNPDDISLHDAQLTVAREYGFASWPKLHDHVVMGCTGKTALPSLNKAMESLRQGRMLILFDDEGRENEGDFVLAAEKVTPDAVNFMTKNGRGTLCLAITEDQVAKLGLTLMTPSRSSLAEPAFTLSIDAAEGVSTGVSAADRARTILTAIDGNASPACVRSPGHVFPLQAESRGVLARPGHTEGSVDLVSIAGMKPAAVICEILNDDGTMARWPDLQELSRRLGLELLKVSDIVSYRALS